MPLPRDASPRGSVSSYGGDMPSRDEILMQMSGFAQAASQANIVPVVGTAIMVSTEVEPQTPRDNDEAGFRDWPGRGRYDEDSAGEVSRASKRDTRDEYDYDDEDGAGLPIPARRAVRSAARDSTDDRYVFRQSSLDDYSEVSDYENRDSFYADSITSSSYDPARDATPDQYEARLRYTGLTDTQKLSALHDDSRLSLISDVGSEVSRHRYSYADSDTDTVTGGANQAETQFHRAPRIRLQSEDGEETELDDEDEPYSEEEDEYPDGRDRYRNSDYDQLRQLEWEMETSRQRESVQSAHEYQYGVAE
ncbi:hypothetical protein BC936DRAFT_147851 [Jimgerdemannia flammicorona]|uniref:Uncharacterized protein n=1 Tax=Jimgerdemannia flammicorona TaxID=994334 RepID=A0A433D4E5_9FUNG|nr:hypothetical protein BC936DRAFT_147851 [Jimgerdemannia flammicorona]